MGVTLSDEMTFFLTMSDVYGVFLVFLIMALLSQLD
jgi:hypothetical protein